MTGELFGGKSTAGGASMMRPKGAFSRCGWVRRVPEERKNLYPTLFTGLLFAKQKLNSRNIFEPEIHSLPSNRIPLRKLFVYATGIGEQEILVHRIRIKRESAYIASRLSGR